MKPNIVNFSDFHAHIFKDFAHPDSEFVTDRFKEQIQVLESVFTYAREHNADILFNGDLFHKRGAVDVKVFNAVFTCFEKNADIYCIMVRGNHDSVTNSLYSDSSLEPFQALPNVTVINTLETVVTPHYTVYGVGYGEEIATMKEWIAEQTNQLDPNTYNILCAHIGVDGSKTGKYSHTLGGEFTVADLHPDKFNLVTLGHYHKRQYLGNLPNVLYVGNTLQTSFADEGQDKGFYFIQTNTATLDFVKTEYTPFKTINAETAPSDLSGAYIQFIGDINEAKAVKAIKEEQNLTNVRVKVTKEFTVQTRLDISAGSTPEQVVQAYVEKNNPVLLEKAKECLVEALAINN